MRVYFHGAARTVTGSQHLISVNGSHLLLDCGLFQGRRKIAFERNRRFPFEPTRINAVLLSHAHIDHSGNLPNLVKNNYRAPIYCTPATEHLASLMLLDSGHIHEADVRFVNRKRVLRGESPIEPLYTQEEVKQVMPLLRHIPYDVPFEPVPGVVATFVEAGHILGSAAVVLDIEENGQHFRLWFSGDIGRRDLPLLRDPVLPEGADYLVMECTYGDKPHRHPQAAFDELRDVVVRTVKRGGKVIIPAFAVGRAQEVVYCLHLMIESGDIPRIPVFVDSPLTVNVSEIYSAHPECYDQETLDFIATNKYHTALGFDLLTYIQSVEESKALNQRKDPMVIISASGMAETGRILHHLKHNIEDPRNTILIVSWQAPHTLGRRLAEREKQVRIFGEIYNLKAEVSTIGGFSAHAGRNFLCEYALAAKGIVRKVFLVHGDERPAEALRGYLNEHGMEEVYYPEMDSYVEM
ncbi:MAG: MBL fold metallo-hydrolase [Chloroflexota bacterium]